MYDDEEENLGQSSSNSTMNNSVTMGVMVNAQEQNVQEAPAPFASNSEDPPPFIDPFLFESNVIYGDSEQTNDTIDYSSHSVSIGASLQDYFVLDANGVRDAIAYIENLIATNYNDRVVGNELDNILEGRAGEDVLLGLAGNDTLLGGDNNDELYGDAKFESGNDGDDTLDGGAGNDIMYGGGGDDTLLHGAGNDIFNGGNGNDTADYSSASSRIVASLQDFYVLDGDGGRDEITDIEIILGSGFNDRIVGDATNTTLNGQGGNDTIFGQAGDDIILGGDGDDFLYGDQSPETAQDGNDTLDGGSGNDRMYGNGGDDILLHSTGNDQLYGGSGIDTADYSASLGAINANLDRWYVFDGEGGRDSIVEVEIVIGTIFADTLAGNALDNTFEGGLGDDLIYGMLGDDTLNGGDGDDTIYGDWRDENASDGNDIINGGLGNDRIIAGGGNDTIMHSLGVDIIDGGSGIDTLDYRGASAGIVAGLKEYFVLDGDGSRDTVNNIENVLGTNFRDRLVGNDSDNVLDGFGDHDVFFGGLGNDTLNGGDGNDTIFGDEKVSLVNDGDDILNGGAGNDLLIGMGGTDTLNGDGGDDILFYDPDDIFNGGAGFDTIQLAGGDSSNFSLADITGSSIEHIAIDNYKINGDVANTLTITLDAIRNISSNNTIYITGDEFDSIITNELGASLFQGSVNFNGVIVDHYYTSGVHLYIQQGLFTEATNSLIGDEFDNVITGTAGIDTIIGNGGNDRISALDGDDIINGGSGDDTIDGDDGNDHITGGSGDDTIDGGNGNDTIIAEDGNDTIDGGAGKDLIYGQGGSDIIDGQDGDDEIYGNAGQDTLSGGAGRDRILGGTDNDIIYGGAGNDTMSGEDGDDEVYGEGGSDLIYGGAGNDILDGGANDEGFIDFLYAGDGDDILIYRTNDIYKGNAGHDTLQLSETDTSNIDFSWSVFSSSSIEEINLANLNNGEVANELSVNVNDVLSKSDGDTLFVTGDAGFDAVTSVTFTAADFTTSFDREGVTFNSYIRDGATLNVQADLTVNFTATINIVNDVLSTNEDQNLTINAATLLANDTTTFANDTLTVTSITSATFGIITSTGPGVWNYSPGNNFSGTDTLTYTVENTTGEVEQGTISIVVSDVNDPLIANNDHFDRDNTNPFSGNLLVDNGNGADIDLDGDTITVTTVGTFLTNRGNTIEIEANGNFIFIPTANFTGNDFFDYIIADGNGATATARLTAGITPENVIAVPTTGLVEVIDAPSVGNYSNNALHNSGPYTGKTVSLAIETGTDVTTRQVIYEQGGGTRGMNIFIENGEVFFAIWNNAEEDWGYVETSASINASETMTVTLVSDGNIGASGTIAGYINGVEVAQEGGVGLLYNHAASSFGRTDGSTVIHNSSTNSANVFSGTINKASFHNEALDGNNVAKLSEALLSETVAPVLLVENAQIDTTENDPEINDTGPYAEKTLAATFTTGIDIITTQVIYEQGGGTRGMNIFIDAGRAYIAAWNYAEENWGYREFSIEIDPDTQYTTTLILDGVQNETGELIGFFDGVEVGRFDDVGLLYSHPGLIGFEQMRNGSVIHDSAINGDGLAFAGELEIVAQYNSAVIDGNLFNQLQDFLNGEADSSPYLSPTAPQSSEIPSDSDNVFLYTDATDDILGGDGFDTLIASEGLTKAITSDSYDGFELIDLSQDNAPNQADDLMVNLDDVLSAEDNILSVVGDSVDDVISTDFTSADRVANVTQDGITYAVFQDSGATLQIELGAMLNSETLA